LNKAVKPSVRMNELLQEKQPMTGGDQEAPTTAEKNGLVKLKIPDEEEEVKFTGLNKEELMRVAGTPGWVRTRWALLVVFWLGWLGMLVGAVLIILQAPRCKDLPNTNWWNDGPLYQIGNIQAFTDTHNLKGLEQKVNSLAQLKVKGLVVGPIHVAPPDEAVNLSFEEISPEAGNLDQFKGFVQAAHKKGQGDSLLQKQQSHDVSCFMSHISGSHSALVFWLDEGVDGIQLSGVERVATVVPSLWNDIRAIVQNRTDKHPSSSQMNLAWNLGGRLEGHMASLVGPALVKLHQLLLLTLPGTPIFSYGDEIGLMDEVRTSEERAERLTCRRFFSTVSELRGKERSLLFGDFILLFNSSSSLAYLRVWDQNERYLATFNWAAEESAVLQLSHTVLPPTAVVVLSTNSSTMPADSSVDLTNLRLGPGEAALLKFPYTG
uniref:Solute carrier family 3 member 2b n=1 Tax=Pundamilia nyererei TaxID=303518 RepID=A0A3B4H9C8_9CICH